MPKNKGTEAFGRQTPRKKYFRLSARVGIKKSGKYAHQVRTKCSDAFVIPKGETVVIEGMTYITRWQDNKPAGKLRKSCLSTLCWAKPGLHSLPSFCTSHQAKAHRCVSPGFKTPQHFPTNSSLQNLGHPCASYLLNGFA